MENPKDINYTPRLDIQKFRENAIKELDVALIEKSARLDQMRKDVAEVQSNYKGESKALERVISAALAPLERDIKEIGEELKKYRELQNPSESSQ